MKKSQTSFLGGGIQYLKILNSFSVLTEKKTKTKSLSPFIKNVCRNSLKEREGKTLRSDSLKGDRKNYGNVQADSPIRGV